MGHVTFEPAPRLKSVDETRQSATRKWLVGVWAISTAAATTGWWAGLLGCLLFSGIRPALETGYQPISLTPEQIIIPHRAKLISSATDMRSPTPRG
jgi:hypothetical protein